MLFAPLWFCVFLLNLDVLVGACVRVLVLTAYSCRRGWGDQDKQINRVDLSMNIHVPKPKKNRWLCRGNPLLIYRTGSLSHMG